MKVRRLLLGAGIPAAKLAKFLNKLRDEPDISDLLSVTLRRMQGESGRLAAEVGCVIGLPRKDSDEPFQWHCLSFSAALRYLATHSCNFRRSLRNLWETRPCTTEEPYKLIFYADEVTPGNLLRPDNRRKTMNYYVTIKDFGPSLTKHECMWLCLGVIRSTVAKELAGGISAVTASLLERLFVVEGLAAGGVVLSIGDDQAFGKVRFVFSLGNVVADADGHRALWSVKGAAGKIPCLLCPKVINDDDINSLGHAGLVPLSCTDPSKFGEMSNDGWFQKADLLAARRRVLPKTQFEALQTATGLTWAEGGLLWRPSLRPFLRPTDVFTYDSMHTVLSNGLAQTELTLVFRRLREIGVSIKDIRDYFGGGWKFCRTLGSQRMLVTCLAPARVKAFEEAGHVKASASEFLMMVPVVAHFLHTVVGRTRELSKEIKSFQALAALVWFMQRAKEDGEQVHDKFAGVVHAHAVCFQSAYPEEKEKPKAHFAFHLPPQAQRDNTIVDAFVGERKHQMLKSVATEVKNTIAFEKTCVHAAFAKQISDINDAMADGLLGAKTSVGTLPDVGADCEIGKALRWRGTALHVGDLLVLADHDALVTAGFVATADGRFFVFGTLFARQEQAALGLVCAAWLEISFPHTRIPRCPPPPPRFKHPRWRRWHGACRPSATSSASRSCVLGRSAWAGRGCARASI